MGFVIPEGVDTMLDIVGVGWPNVDEDAYRDMATALREFADDADDDAGAAYKHIQTLLSSGQSESLDALDKHWSKVQGKHKDLAGAARLVASALDRVAELIEVRKGLAVAELADLIATVGIALAAAPLTMGLTSLLAGAKIAATRIAFKKILREMGEAAAEEIIATLTEPAVAALENMVADLAIQTAFNAMGVQDGYNTDQTVQAGKDGLQLNSAGGPGGGGKGPKIDYDAHNKAGSDLGIVHDSMKGRSRSKLNKAEGHHGRAKGRDSLTERLDGKLGMVVTKLIKASDDLGDHVGKKVPDAIGHGAKQHRKSDDHVRAQVNRINGGKGGDGDGSRPGGKGDDGQRTVPNSGRKPDPASKHVDPEQAKRSHGVNDIKWCRDPIDMASGQMGMQQTDVDLPGSLPLVLNRMHRSQYRDGRFFGPSWSSTLDERLQLSDDGSGGVSWYREDASILLYPRRPDLPGDRVLPVAGRPLPLTFVTRGTSYCLVVQDPLTGLTRHFEPAPEEDGVWWLSQTEDRNRNTIGIERADDGTPALVTHSGGYQVQVDTVESRITGLRVLTEGESVRLRTFRYSTAGEAAGGEAVEDAGAALSPHAGDLVEIVNGVEASTFFTYDEHHRITGWRDSNDTTYAYVYDDQGRVTATEGSGGILNSTLRYSGPDPDGSTTCACTDSLGHTSIFRSNRYGQVTEITDPNGRTTLQTWDIHDNLLSRTDPLGRTTTLAYDTLGNPVSVVRPDGKQSTAEYNDLARPVAVHGFDGNTWRQEYDRRGNRTAVVDPEGLSTRYTYDSDGLLTEITDPTGATSHLRLNGAGLPLEVTDPLGATTRYTYDALGRTTKAVDPLGATTLGEWSPDGKLLKATAPDGTSESWTYDGEGNRLTHTDSLGGTTRFEYGHFDLLAARTSPDDVRYEFAHDTELRLTKVTNPLDLTWTYDFDAAGYLISETDFDHRTQTYETDASGTLIARITPLGQRITFERDAMGRMIRKDAAGKITTYAYDDHDQLVQAISPDAVLSIRHDSRGRVLTETVNGRELAYHYDQFGRRTGRTTPSGVHSTWTYDAAGQREELLTAGRRIRFSRDAAGRETTRSIGDTLTLAHSYDVMGRRSAQSVTSLQGQIRQRDYHYRADGNLIRIDDSRSGTRTFDLDTNGRVTGIQARNWTESYAYDAMGNQTQADWPERHPGQEARGERAHEGTRVRSAGRVRYEYDDAGRTTRRQKARLSTKPDTWHYEWDAEDRLTSVRAPDGATWRYAYDAFARRISKQRLAADGTGTPDRTDFTWDGTVLCEQTGHAPEAPGPVTLTWDHDGHRPLAQTERITGGPGDDGDPSAALAAPQHEIDSRFYAIVTDLVGTPTELLDEAGDIAWYTRTTLWGTTTWSTTSTTYTPLRFPGQYYDPETGLHYNYFRHYDPETSHYLTPDPLGLAPAPNPVSYAENPHSVSDPLGLTPCDERDVTWGGRVRYGDLGPNNRATSVHATITGAMLGGRTNPSVDPAGWESGKGYNRAHLLAAMIGGSNKDERNFVTMHAYANSPVMRAVELQVRNAARDGEIIQYSVIPIYADDNAKIPLGVTIEAHGDRGFEMRPHGGGSGTNSVTIWNRAR